MNRQTLLKAIFPVLILVAVYVWSQNFSTGTAPGRTDRKKKASAQHTGVRDLMARYQQLQGSAPQLDSSGGWGRDPFRQPVDVVVRRRPVPEPQPKPLPELRLNAVMVNPDNAVAVINGEEVVLNGQVEGFAVTEILPERVLLSDGQRTVELRL